MQERVNESVATLPGALTRFGIDWDLLRNFSVLSGGSIVAQVFSVAVTPLLTRLYLPDHLGQLGLFITFINIAVVAASLRYEFAIVSAESDREAAQLTLSAFLIGVPVSTIAALVFYLMVDNRILGYGNMPMYTVVLIVPALVASAAFSGLRYWLLRKERFALIPHGTIVQNLCRSLSQAAFGFLGSNPAGLLAGEIIGRCSGMGRMLRAAWPALKQELAGSSLREFKNTLKINRQFALYSLPSSLLDTLAATISLPLVVYLYGLNAGGSYSLVLRVLALPAVLITSNVADAFHSRAALIVQHEPVALPGMLKRMARLLLLIGIVPASLLMAFGPQMFRLVFGSKWEQAGLMAGWVAPWFLGQFVVSPLSRVVLVASGQQMKFVYDIIAFGGTIAIFVAAHYRSWPVMTAIGALSAVKATAYAIFYFLLVNISSAHVAKLAQQNTRIST